MSDFDDAMRNVERGTFLPVYYLYGEDEYPIQELVKAIRTKIASGPMAQFNLDELSGQSLSWVAIMERVRTLPMMAPRRLVIGWGVDRLFKKSEADDLAAAEAYVAKPLKETVLILTANSADKRLTFFKHLKTGGGALMQAGHPKPYEIPRVVKRFAKAFGKDIDDEAAQALADLVGTETMWIRNEVDKLCLYVGTRPAITAEDVHAVMADIGARDVWALTDALAKRDFVQCMRLMEALVREEEPVMIFGALAKQIRTIAKIKQLQTARRGRDEIAQEIGLGHAPGIADKIIGYARAFKAGEITHIYRRMEHTDLRLKRSGQPARIVLESLIADICLA